MISQRTRRAGVLALLWVLGFWNVTASTNRFETEVRALEKAAVANPAPPDSVMLFGSSSFRLWKDVAARFPSHPMVNRGFGGAQLSDLIEFFDRLVVPAAPRLLLIYGGDNDIAAGKSPERVLADFRFLVGLVRERLPRTRVAFVAIKPSPSRQAMLESQRRANRMVKRYARSHRNVDYLDVATPLLDADGKPDPACFIQDRLHLNAHGYDRWTEVIGPYLRRHAPRRPR